MAAVELYRSFEHKYVWQNRVFKGTEEEYNRKLTQSTTIYVGNIAFNTTEDQIYELFGKVGIVKRIIMGLNKDTLSPCGFCFVLYESREAAENCVKWISGTRLDGRIIRTDIDVGFEEGRQYGRGKGGGQIRDDYRADFDPDRGGYGLIKQRELAKRKRDEVSDEEARNEDDREPDEKRRRAYY